MVLWYWLRGFTVLLIVVVSWAGWLRFVCRVCYLGCGALCLLIVFVLLFSEGCVWCILFCCLWTLGFDLLCFRLFGLIVLWVDVWYARFWFVGLLYFVGLISWFVVLGLFLVFGLVCARVVLFVSVLSFG